VGGLVEHHEERGFQGLSGACRLRERIGEDLLGQRAEIAAQATLVVSRPAQVERMGTPE